MVKGVARHAVVVRSPGMKEFEQAIFIVSADGPEPQVKSPGEMLDLACRLAERYQVGRTRPRTPGGIWPCLAGFASGSVVTAAIWWIVTAWFV